MTAAMTPAEARALLEAAGSDAIGWHLAERPTQPDVVVLVAPPMHLVLLRGAGLTAAQLALMAAAPDLVSAYLEAVEWAEREAAARRNEENRRQWETGALLAAVESALRHLRQGAEGDAVLALNEALAGFARGAVPEQQESAR